MLRDHEVHVCARRDHAGASLQRRHDARCAFRRPAREGDDRLSSLREQAPRMKSICPPTPEMIRCPMESANLAGQVDLHGGVDGDDLVVARDDVRVSPYAMSSCATDGLSSM